MTEFDDDIHHWTTRLVRTEDDAGTDYRFVDCYMNEADEIVGWHDSTVAAEDLYELHGLLQRLLFIVAGAITVSKADGKAHVVINDHDLPGTPEDS